jgi:hypothetical protein
MQRLSDTLTTMQMPQLLPEYSPNHNTGDKPR